MGILQVPALTFTVVHLRPWERNSRRPDEYACHSPRVGRAVLSLSPETNTCLEDALWGASPLLLVLGARASHPLAGEQLSAWEHGVPRWRAFGWPRPTGPSDLGSPLSGCVTLGP